MKILIVSDTHSAVISSVIDELSKHNDADVVIHCGDKYDDVLKICKELEIEEYYRVPGNCDLGCGNVESTIMIELAGKKIMVTHGHRYGVKDGLILLKMEAEKRHADIVLYGHTHIAWEEWDNDILYFNPGSPIMPNDGETGYGVIEINNGNIESKIVKF